MHKREINILFSFFLCYNEYIKPEMGGFFMRKNRQFQLLYILMFFFAGIIGFNGVDAAPVSQDDGYYKSDSSCTDESRQQILECTYSYTFADNNYSNYTNNNSGNSFSFGIAYYIDKSNGALVQSSLQQLDKYATYLTDRSGYREFPTVDISGLSYGNLSSSDINTGKGNLKCPNIKLSDYKMGNASPDDYIHDNSTISLSLTDGRDPVTSSSNVYCGVTKENWDEESFEKKVGNSLTTSFSDDEEIRKITDDNYRDEDLTNYTKKDEELTKKVDDIVFGELSCQSLLKLTRFAGKIYNWIKIGMIVGLVILTMLEYAKAVISDDQDILKKTSKRLVIRIIIVFIVMFLPILINIVFNALGGNFKSCIDF